MPFPHRPFTAIVRAAMQPGLLRMLAVALVMIGLLFNSGMMAPGAMASTTPLTPAEGPAVLASAVMAPDTVASPDGMACCDHAESGGVKGAVKAGLMSCPVACGGWPAPLLVLPVPDAQPHRLGVLPQTSPHGLAVSPAYRPPIPAV